MSSTGGSAGGIRSSSTTRRLPEIRMDAVPSLHVVEEMLDREEASFRERAASVDSKAGVILSAVGVVIALVGIHSSVAGLVAQYTAVIAGLAAVWALLPRVDKTIGVRRLRDRYVQQPEVSVRLVLLSTRLDLHERNETRLFAKARRLTVAACLLLAAAGGVVAGGTINVIWH